MKKKLGVHLFFVLLFLGAINQLLAQNNEAFLKKQSSILITKGQKAEKKGNIEGAVASYEEAYNTYNKNVFPLLLWGRLLCSVGMYERANEVLVKIPLSKLPKTGQARVHLLFAKIAISSGSIEKAGISYAKALKADKNNGIASIRYAMINLIMGDLSASQYLLEDFDDFVGFPLKEQLLAFLADLHFWNLGRSFSTAGEFQKSMQASNYSEDTPSPFLLSLWRVQPVAFFTYLPMGIDKLLSIFYFGALLLCLIFMASRFSQTDKIWIDIAFFIASLGLILVAQHISSNQTFTAAMMDDFSINDNTWIIPRLLISAHMQTIALFFVFPMFQLLPASLRPKRYELYGTWFFCWWFTAFILVFQSRLMFSTRMLYMAISISFTFLSAAFMPLGGLIFYKASQLLGLQGIADISKKDLRKKTSISFTDAKILESKAWSLLLKEDFKEVLFIGNKVINKLDHKSFPQLIKSMIIASIESEDFFMTNNLLKYYKKAFYGGVNFASGQLLKAYLKVECGDFAGALSIVRGLDNSKIKGFTNDETAISLLIIGKCGIAYQEYVQAQKDLSKSFELATLPFIKLAAGIEITKLDMSMNSAQSLLSMKNWSKKIEKVAGGTKTESLKMVVSSILAAADKDIATAGKLAINACKKHKSSLAYGWYANILLQSRNGSKAEQQLEEMIPDSVHTQTLIDKLAGKV